MDAKKLLPFIFHELAGSKNCLTQNQWSEPVFHGVWLIMGEEREKLFCVRPSAASLVGMQVEERLVQRGVCYSVLRIKNKHSF
ncbi:MAG: hypothetical protein ACR2PX_20690 [Endozoicomonas sp.]|uniref:hypothetical protein n=1 Tax=Endozoicomonas sp. TaxID=1892382 RepID=UPI003D9B4264